MKYRKKPVVIEAWLHDGSAAQGVKIGGILGESVNNDGSFTIATLEGNMKLSVGDYLIKGVQGELYPCKPDIFNATYEQVEDGE